jgi:hypothetical protein
MNCRECAEGGWRYNCSFFNLCAVWGRMPRPGSVIPSSDPVPIVKEAGWASPDSAKNLDYQDLIPRLSSLWQVGKLTTVLALRMFYTDTNI